MADVAKRMYGPAQTATTNATLYTAPATGAVVRNIHIANTTATPATYSLAVNATAATAANHYLSAITVSGNGTYDWSGFLALGNAETLQGLQGTSAALTITISGVEL